MARKSDKKLVTLDEAVRVAAEHLLAENLRILNEHANRVGVDRASAIVNTFLSGFIGAILYKVLKQDSGVLYSQEEKLELVEKKFAERKYEIQSAVAAGFQIAMSNWSGQHVEYYCQVRTVPEPINRKLC